MNSPPTAALPLSTRRVRETHRQPSGTRVTAMHPSFPLHWQEILTEGTDH
jgi:hypothetical protein